MRGRLHPIRLFVALSILVCSLASGTLGQAQQASPPPPPPVNQSDDPLLKPFVWRSIGPAGMGGRIDDIAVVESNPYVYYVGFATGGVWKTVNNGTTFEPIFDTYATASIGDVAVCQSDPNIVWVGTGEANNRQSSSWGDGIYKSADAGKTFTNMGLRETQAIARIVIDPKDANVVYVAAPGHLFGPNPERGVFKTTDGGKTWAKIKFIDEDTGFTDLAMDPADNKTLYAASYQRRRVPWGFNGGGPGSGIWKTTDAGKTWVRLEGPGLPPGFYGRVGLDVSRSNPNVVYAQIEVGASAGTGGGVEQTTGLGETPAQGQPGGQARPATPAAGQAAGPSATGQQPGQQGQQPAPPPPDPKKSGVWRSNDKGKTWQFMSNENNRPMYYSQIRVDPRNDQIVYTGGLNFSKSIDGGKTFKSLQQGIAHSDHHAIWVDPNNNNHILIGNDGGLDVSYDQGDTWEFINTIAVGQFYAIGADMRKPYYVYGGLQDNGSWGGPSATRNGAGITNADWYRVGGGDGFYTQIDPTDSNIIYSESQQGAINRLDLRTGRNTSIRPRSAPRPRNNGRGQGGPNAADPQEAIQQFAQALGFGGGNTPNILPTPEPGTQYRFYWNTPFQLSPHNPRLLYAGSERLFKSFDRGETWIASDDLTKQIDRNKLPIMGVPGDQPMASKHDGMQNYGYIVTLAESPALPGVIWVGTDDGNLNVSRDGGVTWTNVAQNVPGVPDKTQISRVEPSHFNAGTCYVTFDNHRADDRKPYVFVTRDYGVTWTSLISNLPLANVNVIREDPKSKNLLYLGTETSFYISLNGGAEWKRLMTGLPTVPIDDILVHPRENDLIVGTHGRSIFILDDITPLQQLSDKVPEADVHLFNIRPGTQWLQDATLSRSLGGAKHFRAQNPEAGTAMSYYLKNAPSGDVKITISNIDGKVVRNLEGTKNAGMNRVQWNLRGDPPPRPANLPPGFGGGGGGRGALFRFGPAMEPGTYFVKLSVDGKDYTNKVVVEADNWKNE